VWVGKEVEVAVQLTLDGVDSPEPVVVYRLFLW